MPRPIFSDKFIQAERELEQKELQAALSRVQDGDWLTSSKRSIYVPSTRSPSPPPPASDVEIEEKFLDPTSQEGRTVRLEGLTSMLSPLGRRIAMELPESLLSVADNFDETVTPAGILTIEIRQRGELIGSCSTRISETDDLELMDDEDMDLIVEERDEDADSEEGNDQRTITFNTGSTRRRMTRSPLHRASGVQVELHRQFIESTSSTTAGSDQNGRLGAGWAEHARASELEGDHVRSSELERLLHRMRRP